MLERMTVVGLVLAAATSGLTAGASSPVAAQPLPPTFVSGDFVGDARDEVFAYRAGEPDDAYLATFSNGGVPGDPLTVETFPFTVDGAGATPVAGDFDGDGRDEIFWYGPGALPDSMWHFQSTGDVVSVDFSVNGSSYRPLVGDYTGDGVDDIHWYAPGTAGDPLWEFNPNAVYTSVARDVDGTYRPVVASIGKDATDDTVWYGPGGTADSLWDWTQGTLQHTNHSLSVSGTTYLPFRYDYFGEGFRGEDIYWYAQGSTGDPVWEYFFGQQFRLDDLTSPHDDATDTALAGDYFGDGLADILFVTNSDLSDFTLFDSSFVEDFTYVVPGAARGAAGVGPEAHPKATR